MDLRDYITEQTNLVEIYFCSDKSTEERIPCSWSVLPPLPIKFFKFKTDQEFTEYTHRNITYQYDLGTDIQKAYQRTLMTDAFLGSCYVASLNEETLPMHRFPCTNEINDKKTIHRCTFKYNNRISFIVDAEDNNYSFYIRYHHVQNMDLDKMNQEINLVFDKVSTFQKQNHNNK
jgi:hypothetical protein